MNFIEQQFFNLLIFLPLVFVFFLPLISDKNDGKYVHYYAITVSALLFLFSSLAWNQVVVPAAVNASWLPGLGVTFALGADGLSMSMVFLTTFLLLMACVASLTSITKRVRLYYGMLFTLITAVLGVFLARDLFLFFLFWELELIPMYLLIAIWGGPRRDYAAMKFVLYTLFGSVFLVAGILGLYFYAGTVAGAPTDALFHYATIEQVLSPGVNALSLTSQVLIFIAMFITFAVKLPMVPLHTWLPDAHVEAPTPISMLLAGILLKMGAYGMLRLCFGFLPEAAQVLAPYIGLLAIINIVYTAGVALVQADMKKLIAYSSVSHMGFVLLGLAALNAAGFNGATFVMFSHGIVSAALFMCVGTLYTRTHSRMIADYGGFGARTPIIFYFFMFMALSSLGLPLMISFAGETLVFYGAFISNAFTEINFFGANLPWSIQGLTVVAGLGIVIGAAYLLWLLKRVFYGPLSERWANLPDARMSEVFVLASMAILVLAYGFYPQALIDRYETSVTALSRPFLTQQVAKTSDDAHPMVSTIQTGERQ